MLEIAILARGRGDEGNGGRQKGRAPQILTDHGTRTRKGKDVERGVDRKTPGGRLPGSLLAGPRSTGQKENSFSLARVEGSGKPRHRS